MTRHLPRRVVYTRHPECLHNVAHQQALAEGIVNRDSPLTPAGVLQRDITADYLLDTFGEIEHVFCSTYSRTRTIPIAAQWESHLVESPLLDERNLGIWHTQLRSHVLRAYPDEESRLRTEGYYAYKPPQGESCVDVEERLRSFLASSSFRNGAHTMYISGHGISGMCLRRILTNASLDDWHSWDRLKNASVTVYEQTGDGYECAVYNKVPWEGKIDPATLMKATDRA